MTLSIILASKSLRRLELLKSNFIDVEVIPSNQIEPSYDSQQSIKDYVKGLAYLKAQSVSNLYLDRIVLAADTIIELDGKVLGKPKDYDDYNKMMHMMSGKCHMVHTAYAIFYKHHKILNVVTSNVYVKKLTQNIIDDYWKTKEPCDKAGGYGIQGKGKELIDRFEGSLTSIIGLPIDEVLKDIHTLKEMDNE